MKLRIVIVGIPGVGKTTVVEKLVKLLPGAKVVTFGTVMFSEAKRRRLVKDRDDLRRLTVDRQKVLQKNAAAAISRMKEQVILVDTHLFIRTKEGFWPGVPFDVAVALKPTHLILVEATIDEILHRRAADSSRRRDEMGREEISAEMQLAREFLVTTSSVTGAPMLVVPNADGGADQTAERLARVIKEAAS